MEGSIHIYCINLKHREDRWKRFLEQPELKTLMKEFTFERFDAINGSAIDIQKDSRISLRTKRNIREHIRRDHEELDSAGGVGCYLSHTSVWKLFLERPETYAIVFEDDAIIPEGFAEDLKRAMKDATLLPQPPDLWFFQKPCEWYFDYKGIPHPYTVKEQNLGPWTTKTCGTFNGYLISKRGAEKLLENAFPIDMHVDMYTCLASHMGNVLTVNHRGVPHMKSYSLKEMDSDIQASKECPICNIPTHFEKRGMLVVSVPAVVIGVAVTGILYYLGTRGGGGLLRRR